MPEVPGESGEAHDVRDALLLKSEKRLRTFFVEARDMVYTSDGDDVLTSLNAAGIKLTGRSAKGDLMGHPFSDLALNPDDRELFLEKLRQKGFVEDYEFILRREDGSTVFCLENATAIRETDGSVVEIQGIVWDISERIQNERELWKANLELAEANLKLRRNQVFIVQQEKLASIGQIAAGIAHEINNPLGFLKSNHTMLKRYFRALQGMPPPAAQGGGEEFLRLIAMVDEVFLESDDGFARIIDIVANLKNFSRIEGTSEFAPYDLNAGIESTLTVAWNEIKYVADVHRDFGELPPLLAKGGEINQVLLNILINSAQAIEGEKRAGRGHISIRTRAGAERVTLEIEDDGPGIPEAIRNRVFDPFFTTKAPGKGTGLGLSISYDIIVARHRGSIEVSDAPGGGTRFTIGLPLGGLPGTAVPGQPVLTSSPSA